VGTEQYTSSGAAMMGQSYTMLAHPSFTSIATLIIWIWCQHVYKLQSKATLKCGFKSPASKIFGLDLCGPCSMVSILVSSPKCARLAPGLRCSLLSSSASSSRGPARRAGAARERRLSTQATAPSGGSSGDPRVRAV
jgi:hypothetical protein